MAMAIEDSVTVSIGEDMSGVFSVIFLVKADVRSYRGQYRHFSCHSPTSSQHIIQLCVDLSTRGQSHSCPCRDLRGAQNSALKMSLAIFNSITKTKHNLNSRFYKTKITETVHRADYMREEQQNLLVVESSWTCGIKIELCKCDNLICLKAQARGSNAQSSSTRTGAVLGVQRNCRRSTP